MRVFSQDCRVLLTWSRGICYEFLEIQRTVVKNQIILIAKSQECGFNSRRFLRFGVSAIWRGYTLGSAVRGKWRGISGGPHSNLRFMVIARSYPGPAWISVISTATRFGASLVKS